MRNGFAPRSDRFHVAPTVHTLRDIAGFLTTLAVSEIVIVTSMPPGLRCCTHGHRVFLSASLPGGTATDALDALAALRREPRPTLVALDGGRPDSDGPLNASGSR